MPRAKGWSVAEPEALAGRRFLEITIPAPGSVGAGSPRERGRLPTLAPASTVPANDAASNELAAPIRRGRTAPCILALSQEAASGDNRIAVGHNRSFGFFGTTNFFSIERTLPKTVEKARRSHAASVQPAQGE